MRSVTFVVAIVVVGLGPGCIAEEGQLPPAGAVDRGDGVFVTRLENPALRGNVYLMTEDEALTDRHFVQQRIMTPDGAFLTADRDGVFTSSLNSWLWGTAEPGAVTVGAPQFLAPSVSLPMGGDPVAFTLHTKRGRERTGGPVRPPLPPIGFDEDTIDSIQVALDPRVLVLPVRFHVFADASGRVPFTISSMPPDAQTFSQMMDPGAVEVMRAASTDSGISSEVQIEMGRFGPLGPSPDPIWTQCDIQFHLDQFELISQQSGLERSLLRSCDCTAVANPVNEPVAAFTTDGRNGREAIDVFIGGSIQGLLCGPSTRAITCGPSAPCSADVPTRRVDAIFITGSSLNSDPNVLAHELGHMIGLGHVGTSPA